MKKKHIFVAVCILLMFPFIFSPFADATPAGSEYQISHGAVIELNSKENMQPSGEFVVSVFQDDQWTEVSRIPCDMFPRDNTVDIPEIDEAHGRVILKITKEGGGAAHIDSIFLNGTPPWRKKALRIP